MSISFSKKKRKSGVNLGRIPVTRSGFMDGQDSFKACDWSIDSIPVLSLVHKSTMSHNEKQRNGHGLNIHNNNECFKHFNNNTKHILICYVFYIQKSSDKDSEDCNIFLHFFRKIYFRLISNVFQ